jgi:hypothetical protein
MGAEDRPLQQQVGVTAESVCQQPKTSQADLRQVSWKDRQLPAADALTAVSTAATGDLSDAPTDAKEERTQSVHQAYAFCCEAVTCVVVHTELAAS